MKNLENPEKSVVEKLDNCKGKDTGESACASVIGGGLVMVVGGYNKEKPPEDDCCPICFGDFNFPCKTNCGHWYCCECILLLWRYSGGFKACKCPMCGCMITKMVPEPSVLSQQGEEVDKVLKDVEQYNRLNVGGLRAFFLKVLLLPRRSWREFLTGQELYWMMRWIGLLLGYYYDAYDLHFFPNGSKGIRVLFEICGWAPLLFVFMYTIWNTRRLRRRVRHIIKGLVFSKFRNDWWIFGISNLVTLSSQNT